MNSALVRKLIKFIKVEKVYIVIIIIIIIIQHLYSAMESEDTEALGGARLRRVKQMSF